MSSTDLVIIVAIVTFVISSLILFIILLCVKWKKVKALFEGTNHNHKNPVQLNGPQVDNIISVAVENNAI